MTRLSEAIGKSDELAGGRIVSGRYARFVDPAGCQRDIKGFIVEVRYWFGRGEHVSDRCGTRRKIDVQILDWRTLNGRLFAIVQVNRDKQETWQRWANRKLVYHLASCPENEPWSIMDAPIVTMGGSRLHWYVRHGYSPLSFLARHDPALFSKVLPCGSDLHGFVVADAEEACATREGR